jgi:hypothetical protein
MNSFSSAISQTSQNNNEVLINVIIKQEADGRTVVTRNFKDFQKVPNLKIVDWSIP